MPAMIIFLKTVWNSHHLSWAERWCGLFRSIRNLSKNSSRQMLQHWRVSVTGK